MPTPLYKNSDQFSGKRQLEGSVEQERSKEPKRQKTKEDTSGIVFGETGPGSLALRNPIIIEKIVGFLDVIDFCRWYDSSETFKSMIDKMDKNSIFWRRRAQKLAAILRTNEDRFEERWPGKTKRDIFLILKSDVESLVTKTRAILDPHPFHPLPLKVAHIADAAILAHHGFLGSVRELSLKKVYLASIPIEHLASLVACVKVKVRIEDVCFPAGNLNYYRYLLAILDNVQCECLSVTIQRLGTHGFRALVRAMRTRVRKLCLGLDALSGFHPDRRNERAGCIGIVVLTNYDGQGKCQEVEFLEMNYMDFQNRQDIEQWVKDIKWHVLANKESFLWVKRKESRADKVK